MKLLVALSALAALAAAQYQPFGYPYAGYYGSYAPITYATHAAVHYSAPAITYTVPEVKEVEVKHVASPITYAAHPFAYGAYPYGYGTPLIYNIAPKAAEAEEEEAPEEPAVETAERKRRSAVLIPAVREATFKTASLDKVEADTPADTTLLKLKETEHKTLVPAPAIAYAAPVAYHAAPIAPIVKQVEVKAVPAPITYATHAAVHYSAPAITYTVPEVKVKEVEVKHVASPITYAAHPFTYGAYPYGYGTPFIYNIAPKAAEAEEEEAPEEPAVETAERKRRSAVLIPAVREATFKTASLDKVEADTPADTTLLKLKETEHKILVPAPAIAYAAPAFTYSAAAPLPLAYRPYSFGYGSPLIYNIAPKAAEAEEKAE